MASIQTGIQLNDQFSSVIYGIIGAVHQSISAFETMQHTMEAPVDLGIADSAREQLAQAEAAAHQLGETLSQAIQPPQPQTVPIQWETDTTTDVFANTGIERFRQEVQSANNLMGTLNSMQQRIATTAATMDLIPPAAVSDMAGMQSRLQAIQQKVQQIENNPVNLGTSAANNGLEQIRGKLSQAVQEQQELNRAMGQMDISAANQAYLRLSTTISNTERYIRDNTDAQGSFNQSIDAGTQNANKLMGMIKGAVGAYAGIQGIKAAIGLSDDLTQTTARLNLMNDGAQETSELFDMVYASAMRTRAPVMATADAIAKMGNNAGEAFSSNKELVAFMEQVNKQFKIGGASAVEQSNALTQLSQAMASGALRGDELNSILDAAPGIARSIEQSMGWAEGSIKSYAAEGMVTAQVVKNSLLNMADETNAAFDSMPMTFGDAMTNIKNYALRAFQPVLQYINGIANSPAFQALVSNIQTAIGIVAGVILQIMEAVGAVGNFIYQNWGYIEPLIYGVVAALGAYLAYLVIVNGLEMISAARKVAMAVGMGLLAAATVLATGATWAQTTAQLGLNGAMYACPLVWIIMLVIALIAIIYAVCNAIAKATGIAQSGLGVIVGAIMVVVSFLNQLRLAALTIFKAIGAAAAALGHNIIAAFHNAISNVQTFFYNLLSTAMSVISKIASALSKLPFVEFDAAGLASAADGYAAKAQAAQEDKMEYEDITAAFSAEMSKMTAFSDGWAGKAFQSGAAWGDNMSNKISNGISGLLDSFTPEMPEIGGTGMEGMIASGVGDALGGSGIPGSSGSTADNTGKMSDTLSDTEEDLKYLRDTAEQEAINRFTTAEIKLDMTNNNNINSSLDLDGVVSYMTGAAEEAVMMMAEGVHV